MIWVALGVLDLIFRAIVVECLVEGEKVIGGCRILVERLVYIL